jgi:hypothetical protein
MQRIAMVMALAGALALPAAGCAPAVAGGLVVAGGASLYGAKVAHGDCGDAKGSGRQIACAWTDMLFTIPLLAAGIAFTATGIGVGVYAVAHDR